MDKKKLDDIYKKSAFETIPWNWDSPPEVLKQLVDNKTVKPCRTIDFGCGVGNYAIYLANNGFEVTGIDISESAIAIARKNANEKSINCNFLVADILGELEEIRGTFDFIYDWFVLHHIFPESRKMYVANVMRLLNPGGKYLSVCFSEKSSSFGGVGKYRKTSLGTTLYFSSENEIKKLVEPLFKIEELRTIKVIGSTASHHAIYALMEKKKLNTQI